MNAGSVRNLASASGCPWKTGESFESGCRFQIPDLNSRPPFRYGQQGSAGVKRQTRHFLGLGQQRQPLICLHVEDEDPEVTGTGNSPTIGTGCALIAPTFGPENHLRFAIRKEPGLHLSPEVDQERAILVRIEDGQLDGSAGHREISATRRLHPSSPCFCASVANPLGLHPGRNSCIFKNMRTIVTDRGQTSVPPEICEVHHIVARTQLEWIDDGETIRIIPIPTDPVESAKGLSEGLLAELLKERERERQRG